MARKIIITVIVIFIVSYSFYSAFQDYASRETAIDYVCEKAAKDPEYTPTLLKLRAQCEKR